MKPFLLPPWRKALLARMHRRQNLVVAQVFSRMEKCLKKATEEIVQHALRTGEYREPSLSVMDWIGEQFYRSVITEAFYHAKDEKESQKGQKRMSGGSRIPPGNLPKDLKSLVKFFEDHRKWDPILKRKKKLIDGLRKSYLEKLKKRFKEVVPKMLAGEASPVEVKAHLMTAWSASSARVDTIFQTETTTYFSRAQVSFFEDDAEIIGFLFDSVRDQARTDICRSRHGLVYRPKSELLRQNTPSLHWRCRSHLIALANTPANLKLLEDPQRDPSKKSVAPLPPGWKK